MSTKSYTLADGTTATVNATANGVPFNEGMNVLTKAIKARVNAGITLTVDQSHFTGTFFDVTTIESGVRLSIQGDGYVTVTY